MNEKIKSWLSRTAGVGGLVPLYEAGEIREIASSDGGRLSVPAIYIPTYTGGNGQNSKRRVRGAIVYCYIDIGNVGRYFADLWVRTTDCPALLNTAHRIRLDTGKFLIIEKPRLSLK